MSIDKTYVDSYDHERGDVLRNIKGELIQLLGYLENRGVWMCKPICLVESRRRPMKYPGELATSWEYVDNFRVGRSKDTYEMIRENERSTVRAVEVYQYDEISIDVSESLLNTQPQQEEIPMKNFDKYEVVEIRGKKGKDMTDDEIFNVIDSIKNEIKARIDSGSYDSEKQKAKVKALEEDVRVLIEYVDSRDSK